MKIKFKKDGFGRKSGEEIEATEAEVKAYGDTVEEVKVDAVAEAVKSFEAEMAKNSDAMAEEIATKAATKALEKISKGAKRSSIYVGTDRNELDPQRGFKSIGEYALAVKAAAIPGAKLDERLKSLGANEATGADGGYAVPTLYADSIYQDIVQGDDLFARTQKFNITNGNAIKVPADNQNTIGASGVTASWIGEGVQIPATKAALRTFMLVPHKLAALAYTTDEVETDNNVDLNSYINGKAAYALQYAISNAIVRGDGNAKPLGFIGHAATVTQTRALANKVGLADIANMYGRFYGDKTKATWVVNQEVFAQLAQMTSGNNNIFLANQSIAGAPIVMMFGLPVVVSEHMSGLGSEGDIALVDFTKYLTAYIGGVQTASSMHLKFDTMEMAYRWSIRVDGRPARDAVLEPATGQGSKSLSPIVVLDDATT